jgi:RNA polymerase sigma-70 factor (ECF subfamily)
VDDAVDEVKRLFDASYRRLVGQMTAFTGSHAEAEDVVQEAFVRAVARAGHVMTLANPEAWLRTVAVNVARSRFRRATRLLELVSEPVGVAPEISPDHVALVAAPAQVPAAQREAIALFHVADLPVREVADLLGVPIGTVKARLARGRHALASLLADRNEELDRG